MSKKKDTVLVSGGAGYIGTHTTVALVEAGYDVVMIDNFSNSEPSAVEGVEKILGRKMTFEKCDTCDIDALRGVSDAMSSVRLSTSRLIKLSVSRWLSL